jgi:hypothetical protein
MSESLRRRAWGFGPGEVRTGGTDHLAHNGGRGEVVFRAAGSLKNRLQPPDGDWSQTCLVFGVKKNIGTFPRNFGGKIFIVPGGSSCQDGASIRAFNLSPGTMGLAAGTVRHRHEPDYRCDRRRDSVAPDS